MRTVFLRFQHHVKLVHPLIINQARKMSSKPQWLVLVNDHPGTIHKRIEVRPQHLSAVGDNQAVKAGGATPGTSSIPLSFLAWERSLCIGAFFSKEPTAEDPMPFAVLIPRFSMMQGC